MMQKWLPAFFMLLALSAHAADDGVLVFGGTGRLGSAIVRELVAAGHPVSVFVRPGSSRERLEGLNVGYVTGDLLDAAAVRAAFAGRSFHSVVEATSRGAADDAFYPTAMANIIAGAGAGSRPRIILHGSVGAGDNIRRFPQADFGRMRATLAAKGHAEQLLIDSGLDWAIIRNGILMPADTPATGQARLSDDHGLMRRVTRADLARLTAQCIARPADCQGRIWHAVDDSLGVPEKYRRRHDEATAHP